MKLKTHSGSKKRIKVTGTGKKKFQKAAKRHLLTNKSKQSKKRNSHGVTVSEAHKKRMSRVLPYEN